MGDVLTTLLEKTDLGQRQSPRVGGGGSSDSSSNKVLASLHFLGKETLAIQEVRKGRALMQILVSLTQTSWLTHHGRLLPS